MDLMELVAKLTLDSSEYESGLTRISRGAKTAFKVAGAAVAAGTAAVVGFGTTSVKTGMEFDKSMAQVAATMGLSMEEVQNQIGTTETAYGHFEGSLRDFAQFMGRNTAFSATQAADALNYMALAGYSVDESMSMLPNVMNLAAAGAMDLATASDMVTDTQTAFGLKMEEMPQLVDEMARAASTGNTSVQQLGEAFLVVGGLAKELNGGFVTLADGTRAPVSGIQEMEIALTAMANAGVKGSSAGTHMRNMIMKLSSPTKEGVETMEKLGVKVFDASGQMRSLADIMGDLSVALGNVSQEEKIQAISDLFNARDLASAQALLGAINQDWNAIGESILDAANGGVLYQGKLYSMKEAQEKFGDAIYDTSKGFQILGSAEAMAMTQLDNLSGDVTLFKSALEGAQIAISDSLTPTLREFVQFGTSGLQQLTDAFQKGGLDAAMEALGDILGQGVNKLLESAPKIIEAGAKLITAFGKALLDNAPTLIQTAVELIKMFTTWIVDSLPQLIPAAIDLISAIADGIIEAIPILIPAIVEVILTITEALTNPDNIGKLIDAAFRIIGAIAQGIIQAIPVLIEKVPVILDNLLNRFSELVPMIEDAGREVIEQIKLGIENAFPELLNKVSELWESLKENASQKWQEISETVSEKAEVIKGFLSEKWDAIKAAYEEHGGGLKGIAAGYMEYLHQVFETGYDAINNLTGGKLDKLRDKFTEVFDKAKETVEKAVEKFKKLMDFKWSLPKLKLPHIKISGHFSIRPPSAPHFSIEWYRKAYDNPYLFTSPTLMGFGDGVGGEMVYGRDNLMKDIADALSGVMGNGSGQPIVINTTVELDGAVLARKMFTYNQSETGRHGMSLIKA